MTSNMSSVTPIDRMVCPNFVFVSLNSSRIGRRIASPTVAKDRDNKKEIIHDRLKM